MAPSSAPRIGSTWGLSSSSTPRCSQPHGRVHSGFRGQHLTAAYPHTRTRSTSRLLPRIAAPLHPRALAVPAPGCNASPPHGQGYRTAAIDLPGFGQSRNLPYVDNNMRAEFLKSALEFLSKGANVTAVGALLVSPSMSG